MLYRSFNDDLLLFENALCASALIEPSFRALVGLPLRRTVERLLSEK
jgi:hypothetical protein